MLRACTGSVAVLVVPGMAIASLLRLQFRSLATWAVIPAFSLATVFVIAEVVDLVALPVNLGTISFAVIALACLALARRHQTRSAGMIDQPIDEVTSSHEGDGSDRTLAQRIALGMLVLAIAVGILIWFRGVDGHGLVPPQVDASNHGFFVARVLHSRSVDVSKVVVSDASGVHQVASFYPLAMHASAAMAVRLTGADVGRVLLVFDVLFASVVLPIGMFVLARAFAPRAHLVAGFTSVATASLVLFPYASIGYGDVPLVVGMALVPITVLVVTKALTVDDYGDTRLRVSAMIAASLVLFTALAVHSSQVPLIVLLVGLLVLERAWRKRSGQVLSRALSRALVAGAIALALFAPAVARLASGVSERSSVSLTRHLTLGRALGKLVTLQPPQASIRQTLLALLALAGAAIWLLRRRPAWVFAYALVLGATLLVWTSHGAVSRLVGLPWYRSSVRLNFNQAFFVSFFAGVALASTVDSFVRLRKAKSSAALLIASLTALVVFAAAIGYNGSRTSVRLLRRSFSVDARVTPASLAAFRWLHDRAGDDDVIINDVNADGSLWMYAFQSLRPLFAIEPVFSDRAAVNDWNDRIYLLDHIGELGGNARADDLVRKYHARWVYFDESVFTLFHHRLHLDALMRNKNLQLAFERGTVHVFRIANL
jgi:hypothetical protein